MKIRISESYQYTNKGQVLNYLTKLIKKCLLKNEVRLIYWHCGIASKYPMEFYDLAYRLHYKDAESVERKYNQCVQKVRKAIPGSELENWISNYTVIEYQ